MLCEVHDAPQLFEFEDIAHSGHLLMKQVDLTPPQKGKGKKKTKKEDEFQVEYFILLSTKHLVHFKPNTGFVDPFKKTINGKSIDLMSATVKLADDEDSNIFEIKTGRHLYLLQPKNETGGGKGDDKETFADQWVDKITEVMLATDADEEEAADENRDYGDFLTGYNDVKPTESADPLGA